MTTIITLALMILTSNRVETRFALGEQHAEDRHSSRFIVRLNMKLMRFVLGDY